MSQTSAEILIIVINALGAGMLMTIAGVIQKIMNDMDVPTFKWFLNKLDKTAMSNPFAVVIGTLPVIVTILYFVFYGFSHWWFTAGLIVWMIGGTITKVINMPVYKWVGDPKNTDPEEVSKQRRTLQLGNNGRAWLTLVSVFVMASQFGVREAATVVGFSIILVFPLLWLARKYMTN